MTWIASEQWKVDLLHALGYTTADEVPLGQTPSMWNLPTDPITFLEDTNEVLIWEVDGDAPEDGGERQSRLLYRGANTIAVRPVRYPMPDGFQLVNVTTPDHCTHRIALRTP